MELSFSLALSYLCTPPGQLSNSQDAQMFCCNGLMASTCCVTSGRSTAWYVFSCERVTMVLSWCRRSRCPCTELPSTSEDLLPPVLRLTNAGSGPLEAQETSSMDPNSLTADKNA